MLPHCACACAGRGVTRRALTMQKNTGEFVDLYLSGKCSAGNCIIGTKDHVSLQMNVAEVDKVTGRFKGQFKTCTICGAIGRLGETHDAIVCLAKMGSIVPENF
ncbi:40S ribosomal protein S21 [Galemys pyrenaicus]|uniref:Small ribosomal subunit protein eS21 n=1 Tax=Galemys pyrenaicus TaxID=202257 RepID=A0A8J6AA00_GALPY|nr:40S ribosomal protein S21 [Galemys pyrenaicus]